MGVRIEAINVEDSGPVSGLQFELGPFNLIYGHNELGKTFLVEFLIRSLFKNHSGWSLRSSNGRGKVVLSGISDQPLNLTPNSKKKLEDYLSEEEPGMPAQVGQLLVVKGAELSLTENGRAGINKEVLKKFLAGHGLLDDIQGKFNATLRKARIENGQIIGDRRAKIKTRNDLQKSLQAIDSIFENIETTYSDGERSALESEIGEIEAQINEQELARHHQAYLINQDIEDIKASLLSEDELNQLEDDFKDYKKAQRDIKRHEETLEKLEQKSEHYEWLEQAIGLYEQRGTQKAEINKRYRVVIPILLVLALIFSLAGFSPGAALSIVGIAIAIWFYWRESQAALENAIDVDELKKLEAEFEERFGLPLSGLPVMQEEKKAMEEAYHGAKTQRQILKDAKDELEEYQERVCGRLESLTDQSIAPEEWGVIIQELCDKQNQLKEQLGDKKLKAAKLDVEEAAYVTAPAVAAYDPLQLSELFAEQARLEETLRDNTAELDTLKQRICDQTRDDISADWETIIRNLQLKREDIAAKYRKVTAEIMASILVNEALDTIRDQEDRKIREKLASPLVSRPLEQITGRYSGVRYDNGQLLVADDYGEFPICDLSTGAREQVLLGLRLGFAAQIFGQDHLFLILDDAFQHADWRRRERLLSQMVSLANDGWQIVYFTMDDHIKELFDEAGDQYFPSQYRCFDLNQTAANFLR